MELADIVRDATYGFVLGLGIGVSGIGEKYSEMFKVASEVLSEKEKQDAGLDDKMMQHVKRREKMIKLILPCIVGSAYSIASSFVTSTPVFQSLTVSVPAAYVGRVAGSAARKVVRTFYRGDLKVLNAMKKDPANTLSYIPKNRKEAIESSFGAIEKIILAGENFEDEELRIKERVFQRVSDAAMDGNKVYSPLLHKWAKEKFGEMCNQAYMQKEITEFYGRSEDISMVVLGQPDNTYLKIFEMDRKNLRTYTAWFKFFEVVDNNPSTGMIGLKASPAEIEIESSKDWNNDFKGLAGNVISNQKYYTVVLIKTPPGMPDDVRTMIVTKNFMAAYAYYQKERAYFSRYTA